MLTYAFRTGPWLAVLLIAVLSLVPGQLRPHTGLPGPAEHTLAYFLTGFFLATRWHTAGPWAMTVVFLGIYAGALELLQNLIPGRAPELIDLAASSAGALGGVALYVGLLFLLRHSDGATSA